MTPDERARIPPPQCCQDCAHRVVYRGVSADSRRIEIRSHCIQPMTGGIMTPICAWHSPRQEGVATQERDQ